MPTTGILRTSLPNNGSLSPPDWLREAARLGLGGLMLSSPLDASPDLDPAALAAFRREAESCGLVAASAIGWLSPLRPERMGAALALGGGDMIAGLERMLDAVARLGGSQAFFQIGSLEDRFGDGPPWDSHVAEAVRVLERLAPAVRRTGVSLLLKTHEEITTPEILRIVDHVGDDVLGVALDPVNLLVRLEDPTQATRRVARHVRQVHLDDAQVRREGAGLRRLLCPIGEGCIDWAAILALVPDAPIWVELHRGQFSMPAFDAAWLGRQPDLSPAEADAVIATAGRWAETPAPDQSDPYPRLQGLVAFATSRE